jgi:hypothetical protein
MMPSTQSQIILLTMNKMDRILLGLAAVVLAVLFMTRNKEKYCGCGM